MTIRIDALDPTVVQSRDHEVPAMREGITVKLSVAQILALIQAGDLGFLGTGPDDIPQRDEAGNLPMGGTRLIGLGDAENGTDGLNLNVGDARYVSLNVGPLAGLRNLLINPLGTINQRGYTSGAATTSANQYTVDRWRVVTSGQNLAWTESAGVRTFTAPAGGVEQVIRGANILTGTYVLNWEGTATATVGGTARTKGETFTLTGGSNVTVRFLGGTFSKPQLEPGSVVTPFELRPDIEEFLCHKYYATGRAYARGPASAANQTFDTPIYFPTIMRTTPTTTLTNGGSRGNVSAVQLGANPFPGSTRLTISSTAAGDCFALNEIWAADAEIHT